MEEWKWMSRRRNEWLSLAWHRFNPVAQLTRLMVQGEKTRGEWVWGWSAPCTTAIRSLVWRRLNKRHYASWKITSYSSWNSSFLLFCRSIKGSVQSLSTHPYVHQSFHPSIQSFLHLFYSSIYLSFYRWVHPFNV